MSASLQLSERVRARFREVFGDPDTRILNDSDHWSMEPAPFKATINILVDRGEGDAPGVWVFNPHVKNDGVMKRIVRDESDLEAIIGEIQEQVRRAAAS